MGTDGVQLLRDCKSSLRIVEIRLREVLFHQGHRHMFGAHVKRGLRPWKLSKVQPSASLLLQNPKHVYFDVSDFAESDALDDKACPANRTSTPT